MSVDPPQRSAAWAARRGFEFDLVSDTDFSNIRRWGLENLDAGELALHAAYLVERDGRISYRKVARRRVRPDELLSAIDNEPVECCAGSCEPGPVCRPLSR